ncbi:MAG: DUF2961 domain-containing protein [Candidatus Latescibacteria bacterium]|nr:DUF2961 domain-containing protein [Candidatus Latescibacterota bacterium]
MKRLHVLPLAMTLVLLAAATVSAGDFDGLTMNLGSLSRLSNAKTRSISPENLTGGKGKGGMATLEEGSAANAARDLGQGWKVNPYIRIEPGETFTLGEIEGPGAIQQIWITPAGNWRYMILRFYWDDEKDPSIECPVGDFFACGWGRYAQVSSLPVCVNPGSAFNCYWVMPFRRKARITMENIAEKRCTVYYQINYTLTDVPDDAAYFHAQFRRTNPLPYKDVYTIVDGIKGKGHYVGTYLCWGMNNNGWWGEGEIKFYMDGDREFPTICGTGTEDYFCGSYGFIAKDANGKNQYREYTTLYSGMPQVIRPDGVYNANLRVGLYRWHVMDPVRFDKDLRVTIQALGWRSGGRYLPLQDDISSVAFWYQEEPHAPFPKLPDKDYLEIQ